jgi:hypothetical protein
VPDDHVRVKLVAPDDKFQSTLLDRADENGYVVLPNTEYEELLDPLFARTR